MQNKILNPSSPYKGVKRRQRSELPRLSQGDDAVFSQTQAARKDWQLLGMFWHSSAVYMKLLQLQLCIHLLVMHHFPLTAGSVGRVVKDHKLFCTSRWLLLLLPPTKEVNFFPVFVCLSVSHITQKCEHGFGEMLRVDRCLDMDELMSPIRIAFSDIV